MDLMYLMLILLNVVSFLLVEKMLFLDLNIIEIFLYRNHCRLFDICNKIFGFMDYPEYTSLELGI